jgi:penicillin amidase
MNNTQMILPTGQSGNVKSPHYKDQARLYHKGKYRTTWFDEEYVKKEKKFRHLMLKPR